MDGWDGAFNFYFNIVAVEFKKFTSAENKTKTNIT